MAPNNFEKQLKEKFLERSIEPASNAWDKLETRLVTKKNGKSYRNIYWLVAAIFIGCIIIFNINKAPFSSENENNVPLVIKDENVKESSVLQEQQIPVQNDKEPVVVFEEQAGMVKESTKNRTVAESKAREILIDKNILEVTTAKDKKVADSIEEEFINLKVDEVLSSISELNEKNGSVTDAEIDALLLKAQREISAERILKNNKVDATALLLDVEEELDKSFRDKVFKAIKNGYLKVKTAVAERNH